MFRPAFDGQTCSLGYQVVDWIEAYACHGPVALNVARAVAAVSLNPVNDLEPKAAWLAIEGRAEHQAPLRALARSSEDTLPDSLPPATCAP